MTRSILVLVCLLSSVFLPAVLTGAQQLGKLYRIGCLVYGSRSDSLAYTEALRNGLRELGYVEGQTISLEWRYARLLKDVTPKLSRVAVVGISTTAEDPEAKEMEVAARSLGIGFSRCNCEWPKSEGRKRMNENYGFEFC